MASWPGPTLEDYVADILIRPTEADIRAEVARLEPVRDYVEETVLAGFEPDRQSWRDYRNATWECVESELARHLSGES